MRQIKWRKMALFSFPGKGEIKGSVPFSSASERGWSQDDLADAAGLHRTYIGTVERAEQSITLDSVEKIAKAFKVPVKEMFED